MENPNRSLLQIHFEISTDSKIRQKLLNLALMRDRSQNPSHSSRSCKRDSSCNRDSSCKSVKDRSTAHSPQPKKPQKLQILLEKLIKSTNGCKIFTKDLENLFKLINFDSCFEHREKVLKLEDELKCLKAGQSLSGHVIRIVEDLAVSFGLVSAGQIRIMKKSGPCLKKLIEILEWFNIGRVKALPVSRFDADLFRAVLVVTGKEFGKGNAVEVFRGICGNPGLGVKTFRGITELVKRGVVDKGKNYLEIVEKAYSYYQSTIKYTDVEGIGKLAEMIEELAFVFNVYPKLTENVVRKNGNQREGVRETVKNFHPSVSENREKRVAELCPTPKSSEGKEILTNRSSKAILLNNFYSKSRLVRDKPVQDDYQSDNTDISETESTRKLAKNGKVKKMFLESRCCKRLEKSIEHFFIKKIAQNPPELEPYIKSADYNWKKLDFIKFQTPSWTLECKEFINSHEFIDPADPLLDIKRSAVLSKINETGFVDNLLFKIHSEAERKLCS